MGEEEDGGYRVSRPRAGHAFTAITRNGKMIWLLQLGDGRWMPTSIAMDWPRCPRCRRPTEPVEMAECGGKCCICYYYKSGMSSDEFWRRHNAGEYFAPYNIGRRMNFVSLRAIDRAPNWRQAIAAQISCNG